MTERKFERTRLRYRGRYHNVSRRSGTNNDGSLKDSYHFGFFSEIDETLDFGVQAEIGGTFELLHCSTHKYRYEFFNHVLRLRYYGYFRTQSR